MQSVTIHDGLEIKKLALHQAVYEDSFDWEASLT